MRPRPSSRLALAIHAICLGLLLPGAQAQTAAPLALDRIDVTGTRIKKAVVSGQIPVQSISRADIARSGVTSIGDLLQQLTLSGSSLNTRFNSSGNFGFPPDGSGVGAGSATADLRHLGSKRVLVLVDGIRWVNEASASGVSAAIDLNTLPLNMIERVDVLQDGASTIYGSDAIGGVINLITRRQAGGALAAVQYGQFGAGDGETRSGEISIGGVDENAGWSWFLGASLIDQQPVFSRDRAISRFPKPGTGLTFGSSATPLGRFRFRDPNTGAIANITLDRPFPAGLPRYNPNAPGVEDDFHVFGNADRFNFAEYNLLLTPSERRGVFGQARIAFNDNLTWYTRVLLNRRDSENQAAPEPIFLGPDAGIGNRYAESVVVSRDNPYNPFGFDLIAGGPNANLFLIGRRPLEGGPRRFLQQVDTWYVASGLEGVFDIGDAPFYWDLNLAGSRNAAEQTNYGSYNIRRINEALGPVAQCQAIPGCVPLNLFGGPGTITPAMLAFIQPVVHDRSDNRLALISANLTGDIAELWAGPLALATGFEHRKLQGRYQPDPITIAGEYNGVPSGATAGEYDVDEAYLEFNLPVYATAGSELDLSAAARYSDYSTFGGNSTGKLGFRWQFGDELLLRGSLAEGFRAPSIGELFGTFSRFDAQLTDPCSLGPNGEPAPGNTANCRALGVPAGYAQANPQIPVITGGNAALQPETAKSVSLGLVWSPEFATLVDWSDRLDIELTWYRHRLDDAIQAVDAQTQLNRCVATLDPNFCAGIGRAATGAIGRFNNVLQNIGEIRTAGFDFDVSWLLPETDFGSGRVEWHNTYVDHYSAEDVFGVRQPRRVGIEVNNSAIPRWRSNLALNWQWDAFELRWASRYIDTLYESCAGQNFAAFCNEPSRERNRLGAVTYHDLQLAWQTPWHDTLRVVGGVNNVGGKEPPPCLSCTLNGYDPSTYDAPGRFWYLRLDVKF